LASCACGITYSCAVQDISELIGKFEEMVVVTVVERDDSAALLRWGILIEVALWLLHGLRR
jgi:hypothetical protein